MEKSERPVPPSPRKRPKQKSGQKGAGSPLDWESFDVSLRGLRNLNAMQLQLIDYVERIGKQMRRRKN